MKFKGYYLDSNVSKDFSPNILYKFENEIANVNVEVIPKHSDEQFNGIIPQKNSDIFQLELKRYRAKRSNDANSYMWVLCDELAKKIGHNTTKEEIYRKAIREVGVFEVLPLKKEAVSRFIQTWQNNGVGWVCENMGKSKIAGYINIVAYYGSSTYNTAEMSRLINYIVEEAKDMGIETLPPKELEALKNSWGC